MRTYRMLYRSATGLVALALCASVVQAQSRALPAGADLPELVVSSDTLGDGWILDSQGPDSDIAAFPPKPVAAYGANYTLGQRTADRRPASVSLALYQYADRATALASPGFRDRNIYWGHGNTTYRDLSGIGDGPSYRAYPPGIGATAGITFIGGNVVVFVRGDRFGTVGEADAMTSRLASASDALLRGTSAPPETAASPARNSQLAEGASAAVMSAVDTSPDRDRLKAFIGPVLVPREGQMPFANLQIEGLTGLSSGYSARFVGPSGNSSTDDSATITGYRGPTSVFKDPNFYLKCNPAAPYCTWLGLYERFLGLRVKGFDAVAEHSFCTTCSGPDNAWSVTWFDTSAGVSYRMHLGRRAADAFGRELSAANLAGAKQLAALASEVVLLGPPTTATPCSPPDPAAGGSLVAPLAASPQLGMLNSFPCLVLLPPADLQPFASTSLDGINADVDGYSVSFFKDPPGIGADGAGVEGTVAPDSYLRANQAIDDSCGATAQYCGFPSGNAPGELGGESFRGLSVRGSDAIAVHGECCGNRHWHLYWIDTDAGVTFDVSVANGLIADYGIAYSADNRAGAERLAALASKLVRWSGR